MHMHCCTLLSFAPSFSAFCFFHFSLGFSPPESVQLSKRPHNTESHKSFYFPCVSDDGVVDNLLYPLSRCKHETRDQKVCFLPHPCFYNISNIFVQAAHPRHHTRRSNPNSRDLKILKKKRRKKLVCSIGSSNVPPTKPMFAFAGFELRGTNRSFFAVE